MEKLFEFHGADLIESEEEKLVASPDFKRAQRARNRELKEYMARGFHCSP